MESFSFNVVEKVLERLASHAYQEIRLALDVDDDLIKLQETLSTIAKVVLDAEEKQRKDPLLADWLGKLKDVCYDMDDVLDHFEFRKLRMQVLNSRSNIKGKVCNFFSRPNSFMLSYKIGQRIKDIRERLGEIAAAKAQFNLYERAADWQGMHIERETHSFVHAPDVIGRDKDKEEMVMHLLNANRTGHGEENVSVISINGLGGLGKTTLAKLVYNDNRVVGNFELRIWVCVSDDFDNKRLLREIVTAATSQKCVDESIEQMQIKLRHALTCKKLLLVLDDVWDKGPMGITVKKWIDLKSLLNVVANGSKIIVTTRNESVALLMGHAHRHLLKGLPHSDCMTIFIKVAFTKREQGDYPKLIKIGEDIVKKCGGVPLALYTLGGLLYSNKDERYWSHVRDSDIWKLEQGSDDILPALKLSYDALPIYLKPCFAFCSLYPKDYVFRSAELIPLLMAEGFIQSSKGNGNQDLEDIGLDYIRQLCSRYFFQIEEDDFLFLRFRMHDLVHDLAISMARVEYSSLNFRPSDSSKMVRHVSISQKDLSKENEENPKFLLRLEKLRTILIPDLDSEYVPIKVGINSQSFLKKCISRINYLRVLDLSNLTLKVLPCSIGNLSHLRYLDVSYNQHINKLPDSICKLHHLQSLLLINCGKLKELPEDMGNLISLRYLALTINKTHLPEAIGRLTSLRTLCVSACKNLKSLGKEMRSLTNLRMLVIVSCQNLESLSSSNMTTLETLVIYSCPKLNLTGSAEGIRGLQSFWIVGSNLTALPHWLQESANTLKTLQLGFCTYLQSLPEWFQNFTSLQKLKITYCSHLFAFPEGMDRLTALRELEISNCPLVRRCRHEGEDWSKIAHVPKIILNGQRRQIRSHG
ncbi:unnamed protein product [Prunus armeniaca]